MEPVGDRTPRHSHRLPHCTVEDLRDLDRLLGLYGRAVARGVVRRSMESLLYFAAWADRAVAVAANPPALFAHCVNGDRRLYGDEYADGRQTWLERASRRLCAAGVFDPPGGTT
jgi:hypothetical protein